MYIAVFYACINTHYLKKIPCTQKKRTASSNVNSNSKKIWVRRELILPSLFLFPWLQGLLLKRLRIFESFKNNQLGTCAPSFTQWPAQQFILSCSLMDSKRLRAGDLGVLNWHGIFGNLQVLRNERVNELSFLRIGALSLIKGEWDFQDLSRKRKKRGGRGHITVMD